MRVLQVLPSISSESGGPPRTTLATCRALHAVDSELRTTLATTTDGLCDGWRHQFEARLPTGMNVKMFPAVGRHAFMFSTALAYWLWSHAADFDLVVIRILLHPISSISARIARCRNVPYVLVPHGTISKYTFEHRRTWLKRMYYDTIERGTLATAAAIQFTSEAERNEAPLGCCMRAAHVIPHPFEPRFRQPATKRTAAGHVLFLSRLHAMKGLDVLLPAFRMVVEDRPETRLVIAGAGANSYQEHLQQEVQRLGLQRHVQMLGFVEGREKTQLLSEASVFVLPSRRENFGVAVVEAMDAGLPVVITRKVGIWKEIQQANAGIVAELDAQSVCESLLSLLYNIARRRRMGANGRGLVRTHFNPDSIGLQLRHLYESATATVSSNPMEHL